MLIPVYGSLASERRKIRFNPERFGRDGLRIYIGSVEVVPECCRYRRGGPSLRSALQDMSLGAPWERIGIDLTGIHPRSRRENCYILTYVDHFTKFAEAFLIPNKEAVTVARVLVEQVFLGSRSRSK